MEALFCATGLNIVEDKSILVGLHAADAGECIWHDCLVVEAKYYPFGLRDHLGRCVAAEGTAHERNTRSKKIKLYREVITTVVGDLNDSIGRIEVTCSRLKS